MKGILNGNQKRWKASFIEESEVRQRESELVPFNILTVSLILKFETISSIQASPVLDKQKLENLISK